MNHQKNSNDLAGRVVAVIGASADRGKYGNRAVRAYRAEGWRVIPVNLRQSSIEGLPAVAHVREISGPVHRATVYLPPEKTLQVLEELVAKNIPEIFLNPGSESPAVVARGQELGLNLILACSIVDIGRSPANPD